MGIVGYVMRSLTIICICFLLSSMTISSASGAASHGCASATPPPVAGTLIQPEATAHVILINEALTNPGSHWNCSEEGTQSGSNDTWVELYNPQNEALDLYTVHSSLDSGPNTTRSYLPLGAAIAARSFIVIFPPVSLFAQLTSSAGSSVLRLLIGDTVVDQVALFPLVSDTSYSRMPDGGDTWQITDTPTIDASNVPPTPTPIPIHTPKSSTVKTTTQKSSGKSSSTGKLSTIDGGTTNIDNQPEGTQPAWKSLSVPTPTSSNSETSQSNASNVVPQGVNTGDDLTRKVLLTSLAAAFLLGLLWSSRYFTKAQKLFRKHPDTSSVQEDNSISEEAIDTPTIPESDSLTD